jgi:hypothetical protein
MKGNRGAMPALHTQLRNRLEAAVKQARRTAEAAAKVVLERLTVGSAEPGTHLSVDERQLRNRLRAHGRQLGDGRDPKTGAQASSLNASLYYLRRALPTARQRPGFDPSQTFNGALSLSPGASMRSRLVSIS